MCWLALWPVVFFCLSLVNAKLVSQPPLSEGWSLVRILCSLCPSTHTWAKADLLGLIFHCFNADSADKSRSPPETQPSCVHRRCQCHQCMNNTCPCSGIMLRLGRMKPTNQWLPASMADPLSPAGHPVGLCYKWAQALGTLVTLGSKPFVMAVVIFWCVLPLKGPELQFLGWCWLIPSTKLRA